MKTWTSLLGAALLLAACAGAPRTPDWQLEARGAADRYVSAYLSGSRGAEAEWQHLRQSLARTAQPQLLARAELLACAVQVASLVWADCPGFEKLRASATATVPELAYADYLQGRWPEALRPALPAAQRRIAEQGGQALPGIEDPLTRLLGAAVLLRSGQVPPAGQDALIALAVDAASSQGWRRPLLAWLGLQLERAQAQGRSQEAAQIRQRLAVLEGVR